MLQLNKICKSYTTGSFTQKALDEVSVTIHFNGAPTITNAQ